MAASLPDIPTLTRKLRAGVSGALVLLPTLAVVARSQLPSQSVHPEARLDWRLDMTVEAEPHALPEDVADRLRAYQRAMGLRYGAYDLRRAANGRYVFFEVNPGGQVLFVEIQARHGISAAVAEALLGGEPRAAPPAS